MEQDEKIVYTNEKMPYNSPVLTLYGEVAQLTESGNSPGLELFGPDEPENPDTIGPNYNFP